MNPIDDLATILSNQEVAQSQREALVDIVVWAMYVDGSIKHEENVQIDEVVTQLSATTAIPLTQYLPTAIAKIRDVWTTSDKSDQLLATINERLATQEMRNTAYALCEAVTRADDELADAEQAFLARLRNQLGLDKG